MPSNSPRGWATEPNPCDRPMLSVAEFAHCHNLSRSTFYRLLREGRGPETIKIGRRTLIPREASQAWRQQMATVCEPAQGAAQ